MIRQRLGHPAGLWVLAGTEAWERFSFYGMQALLTLYMIDYLLLPQNAGGVPGLASVRRVLEMFTGKLTTGAFASEIFGMYTAAVYVTPVLGSLLADRWLGRTAAVMIGCALMAAGHFAMALDASFLPALLLLICGCGLLKGNIASQVGGLYAAGDARRTDAFQIFSMAIAIGVIAAPLVCGSLAQAFGWHWGFGAAGVGMLAAASVYMLGRRSLPGDAPRAPVAVTVTGARSVVLAQLTLLPLLAICFIGNNQVYNIYLVWAREHAALGGFPVTWLVSYDAAISTVMLPIAVAVWRMLGRRGIGAHELTKMTGGAACAVLASLMLAAGAAWSARTGQRVPLAVLLGFHVVNSIAFVHLLPVGLSLFSRTAPAGLNATMIGTFYTLFFGTNLMVGALGAHYGDMAPAYFWLLQAGLMAGAAFALAVLHQPLSRILS